MPTSTSFLAMRKDGKQCIAYETKFEKTIGDRLNINGADYYVFMLHQNITYARACNNMYAFSDHFAVAKRELPNVF